MARLQGKKSTGWAWLLLIIILAVIIIGLIVAYVNPALLPIGQ